MKICYIIGYRHKEDRYNNLSKTLDWLLSIPNLEVLIVEQDTESKFKNIWSINHVFLNNPHPYNRSWAFNVGVKEIDADIYAFGDSDLVMKTDEFLESINELENYDVVSPYKSVLDLTEDETKYNLENWLSIKRPGRGETDNQKINLCGGLVLFTKKSFEQVGGWNEDFIGWGGEDDFMTLKVNALNLKTKEMPYKIYHLYHTREQPNWNYYQRNLSILNQSKGATKIMVESYVNKVLPLIGDKNKYTK